MPIFSAKIASRDLAIRDAGRVVRYLDSLIYPKNLHHLIPQVIDHLHRNAPRLRLVERARHVAVQRRPGVGVDLGLQRGLQRLVGVVGAEEIGVTDEEGLHVVVGVDEP